MSDEQHASKAELVERYERLAVTEVTRVSITPWPLPPMPQARHRREECVGDSTRLPRLEGHRLVENVAACGADDIDARHANDIR